MDPIFITNTVAEKAKKLKQPMFVAFIDFAKAFDSVHHQLLWMKLSALGFSTRMLKILQNMYLNASSVVMMDGCISTSFPCKIGVRQGCPLSPILFSLYISDLESQISCESTGFITILNQSICTLMFADDLALFADSPAGLQHSLSILEQFCHQWKLNINAQKSKVLIFSKAKLKLQYRFYINQSEVEVVHSYKYLGFIITSNGSLKSSVSTLVNQARKAMFVLMKKAAYLNYPPPALMCKLFDALVAPVCEYACEWWGFQEKNDIELLHRKFCK